MSTLFDDVRYAWRMLLKTRGATFAALLAFALGLGANMATYSIADALVFRALLLKDVDRLVQVSTRQPGYTMPADLTPADFRELREQSRTLESLAASEWWTVNLTGVGSPLHVRAFRVTANFFGTLGAQPLYGRTFAPDEDTPGRDDRLVLGHGLWTRLGAEPGIVGRIIRLNGRPYEVIGVMPPDVRYPAPAELWIPLALSPRDWQDRDSSYLAAAGRLEPGVSVDDAHAEIATLMARIVADHPTTHRGRRAQVTPLRDYASGNLTRDFSALLLGAVAFVLLIACANVANLQFARVSSRMRELAVRTALGASRWRVTRQLIVEGVLLALGGVALSALAAAWSLDLLRASMPAGVRIFLPGWDRLGLNGHALLYSLALALVSGVIAGLAAAPLAIRADAVTALKDGGRTSAGIGRRRLKSALVLCQIVLTLVLLVGAGLMIQGVRASSTPLPDAKPEQVLTSELLLPDPKYDQPATRRAFVARTIDALSAVPGVSSAALVSELPYSGNGRSASFRIEGEPVQAPSERRRAHARSVTDRYFAALRIPLRAGREFTKSDDERAPAVAIVSETFAQRFFPGGDAIGRRITTTAGAGAPDAEAEWVTIVGVAGDVLHDWTDRAPQPTLYRPYAQATRRMLYVTVRAAGPGDALALAPAVSAAVASVDREQSMSLPITWKLMIDNYLAGLMYVAGLMGVFGLVGLLLAVIGLYGMLAFDVSARTREIGVRMAMGATAANVLGLVVRRGVALTVAGVALGLVASIAMAQALSSLLFGVGAHDFTAFGVVSVLLVCASIVACAIPARRASRIDPVVCLRVE